MKSQIVKKPSIIDQPTITMKISGNGGRDNRLVLRQLTKQIFLSIIIFTTQDAS